MVPLREWSTPTFTGSPLRGRTAVALAEPGDFSHGRHKKTASPINAKRDSPATAKKIRRPPAMGGPDGAVERIAGTFPLSLGRVIGICPERVAANACKSASISVVD